MARTLQDVITECDGNQPLAATAPKDAIDEAVDREGVAAFPFWVVVVNPRRTPPKPKLYKGFKTLAEADACAAKQDTKAKADAAIETQKHKSVGLPAFEPFRYFAIERPEGGILE